MKNWSLKWRIIFPISVTLVLGIGIMTWLIADDYSRNAVFLTERVILDRAGRVGNQAKAELELSFGNVAALASILGADVGTPAADRETYVNRIARMVEENQHVIGAWTCFEPNAFDGRDAEFVDKKPYHDSTGRFIPYLVRVGDRIDMEPLVGYEIPGDGDYYLLAKNSGRQVITSPYGYMIDGKEQLLTSLAVPVKNSAGRVVGVAGADILLESIGEFMNAIRVYDTGYAFLVDHQGTLVTYPDENSISKNVADIVSRELANAIAQTLADDTPRTLFVTARTGQSMMCSIFAFPIADTGTSWAVVIYAPEKEVMAAVRTGLMKVIGIGIVMLVVALSMLFVSVSRITRVLDRISHKMLDSLQQVADASGPVRALAEGTTEQAALLEETSATLEQMASMTHQNADNTSKGNEAVLKTATLVHEGAAMVDRMSAAMGEINDCSEQISRIIKTIEEIASQTNLLALNAAVEAARAGEAGKGFAVVAEEVRNLAQRSALSARDTSTLIESTVARVHHGSEIVGQLTESYRKIEESAETVSRLIREVTTATTEQAQRVDQVNTAVSQMDQVTQQNAASAEKCASSSEELTAQAKAMQRMVGELVTLVDGVQTIIADNKFDTAPSRPTRPAQPSARRALPPPRPRI